MKGEVYKCITENSIIISPTCRKLLVSTNKVKGTRMGFLVPLSENQFFFHFKYMQVCELFYIDPCVPV